MTREILNGEEALARGTLDSGVRLVTSYPGSPSTATVAEIVRRAGEHGVYVEWSSNEKVALEMAMGASIAGRRALVAVKNVGMNALVDPILSFNLTRLHGGLVVLLGDDPGGYGSQNDQDTRPLVPFLELPMLEPSGPAEGYGMIREAFAASERFQTAFVVRITRGFSLRRENVEVGSPVPTVELGLAREPWRFVPAPANAVAKHGELHRKLDEVSRWADGSAYNAASGAGTTGMAGRASGATGVIAGGFVYRKLLDVIGEASPPFRLLKLGSLYPLPRRLLGSFLAGLEEVLVLEEIEPFLEERIAVLAHDLRFSPQGAQLSTRIRGKRSGDVGGREGELYRWQIQEALEGFLPGFEPARRFSREAEDEERPRLQGHCADCGYDTVLDALDAAAVSLGQRPVLIGDPGCLVTVAKRLDAKLAMGSAVAVADGVSKAGTAERAVALVGDSSFFHTTLPALANAVHNRSDVLVLVLDNGAAVTTGSQPHPGVGRDAFGAPAPALDMLAIARACGVVYVAEIDARGDVEEMRALFRDVLGRRALSLVRLRL